MMSAVHTPQVLTVSNRVWADHLWPSSYLFNARMSLSARPSTSMLARFSAFYPPESWSVRLTLGVRYPIVLPCTDLTLLAYARVIKTSFPAVAI